VRAIDAGAVYSINILSEPTLIEMTIVDDGSVRLTALKSSFVTCA
jgi:hypothetical protein